MRRFVIASIGEVGQMQRIVGKLLATKARDGGVALQFLAGPESLEGVSTHISKEGFELLMDGKIVHIYIAELVFTLKEVSNAKQHRGSESGKKVRQRRLARS